MQAPSVDPRKGRLDGSSRLCGAGGGAFLHLEVFICTFHFHLPDSSLVSPQSPQLTNNWDRRQTFNLTFLANPDTSQKKESLKRFDFNCFKI